MRNEPCNECPFRKTSIKGWLGGASGDPELFLRTIEQQPIPCHTQLSDEDWSDERLVAALGWSQTCVGSLQFMKNTCKLPWDKRYASIRNASDSNSDVFEIRQDFIDHHKITTNAKNQKA